MTRVLLLTATATALAAVVIAPGAVARPTIANITVVAGKPSEFHFKLSKSSATSGVIVFKLVNSGALPHDFKFCSKRVTTAKATTCTGRATKTISPGQSTTLRVTVILKGTYEYLCTVPGHAAGGMKGIFRVT